MRSSRGLVRTRDKIEVPMKDKNTQAFQKRLNHSLETGRYNRLPEGVMYFYARLEDGRRLGGRIKDWRTVGRRLHVEFENDESVDRGEIVVRQKELPSSHQTRMPGAVR